MKQSFENIGRSKNSSPNNKWSRCYKPGWRSHWRNIWSERRRMSRNLKHGCKWLRKRNMFRREYNNRSTDFIPRQRAKYSSNHYWQQQRFKQSPLETHRHGCHPKPRNTNTGPNISRPTGKLTTIGKTTDHRDQPTRRTGGVGRDNCNHA